MNDEIGNRQSLGDMSVAYSPPARLLEIEFSGGSVYQYDDVPADVVDGFVRAENPSEYFAAYIRPMFPTWKIVDGARVALADVKLTPKARGYLLSLARKHSLCADHPNALIGSAFRSMLRSLELRVPDDGTSVSEYVENIKQADGSKIIEYLKAL